MSENSAPLTKAQVRALRQVQKYGEALWRAHVRSHDTQPWPVKYSMNYGALMQLRCALDMANETDEAAGRAALEQGEQDG